MKAFNDDPELLEIPEWLGHLRDYISANLSDVDKGFEARLMSAIKLGGDMDAAHHRIHARIQREVVPNPTDINERVALLHDRAASGDMPSDSARYAAGYAARSAAESAARSARSAAIAQLEQIVLDEVTK